KSTDGGASKDSQSDDYFVRDVFRKGQLCVPLVTKLHEPTEKVFISRCSSYVHPAQRADGAVITSMPLTIAATPFCTCSSA
ncbi:MAG: hypothetical protein WBW33_27725, partial [Bryobacteraceae bacterium]